MEKTEKKPVKQAARPAAQPAASPAAKATNKPVVANGKVAAVLVRGLIGTRVDIRDTLYMLRLRKKHACVVLPNTPITRGMLQKAKDFITYGPVSDATVNELSKARPPVIAENGILVFNLAPPRGGFERAGIKKTYVQGGALGIRRDGMDALLKKMM